MGEPTEAGQPRTESVGTVVVAGGANLAVAVAKLYPAIRYVFLDPTRGRAARAPRS